MPDNARLKQVVDVLATATSSAFSDTIAGVAKDRIFAAPEDPAYKPATAFIEAFLKYITLESSYHLLGGIALNGCRMELDDVANR